MDSRHKVRNYISGHHEVTTAELVSFATAAKIDVRDLIDSLFALIACGDVYQVGAKWRPLTPPAAVDWNNELQRDAVTR